MFNTQGYIRGQGVVDSVCVMKHKGVDALVDYKGDLYKARYDTNSKLYFVDDIAGVVERKAFIG